MKKQAPAGRKGSPSKTVKAKRASGPAAKARVIRFAVIGDSHVGYGNSSGIFKHLLSQAVRGMEPGFVIFGGDNVQAGADRGSNAAAFYKDFKDTVTSTLGSIPYKASIGNWEAGTRTLFTKYLGAAAGQMNFPGTQGKVKYVWLDCALGRFSPASLALLKKLDDQHYYVIGFHWPLRLEGITVESSHVLSQSETVKFFSAIPSRARDRVLAIFTHHGHLFYRKLDHIYPGFPTTKFFVCGCAGDYKCKQTGDRGYYDAALTIKGNQAGIEAFGIKVM
ncbi:metallophosphoesterase [Paenibacillus sp. S150]|uniref:metallophosphoesterase family protein n=1 Tax=Paenibacillus sp. S150 TaxID=2749826 RepID=UPI001C5630D4|nr:metallophosphoesterase [Paenibacillus sp. S150]MBW4084612.1 metallophosphoesterase [Paenibacillus sp. S150]